MEAKEKVKDFNIQFNTFLNRIPTTTRPTDEVLMEFYITALPVATAMLVKRSNTQTLQGAIYEAIKVENEMISLTSCHHTAEGKKASQSSKKSNGSGNRVAKGKERDTTDVEGFHWIIKKLANTVIDMKRNYGESTSGNGGDYNNRKPFKPFYRKKTEGGHGQLALLAPPNEWNLNMEDLDLTGSLLNKEEPIVELEPKQENEEEYHLEEPLDEESQINVLRDFYTNENDDDEEESTTEIHTNEIHTQSKGPLLGGMKPVDQTKKDVCPLKASTPKVPIEKGRPSGESKNTLVTNYPKKENASLTTMKVTPNGTIPLKYDKTGMFTLPYPIYNIDYNIVDDLKKSQANITYFYLLKLTQQRDLLLKAINEWNCKTPTILSSQTKKLVSRPITTPSTAQTPSVMEATLSKMNRNPQDVNAAMIGRKSKSMTPPFLITFEILNMNVHNFLVDFGASSTVMPYVVAKRLHAVPVITPEKSPRL